MKDWKKTLISHKATIQKAIQAIDKNSIQFALVVDDNGRLVGTVTDGDIRRGILKNTAFDSSVQNVMNKKPIFVKENAGGVSILKTMQTKGIRQLPIVDCHGVVVGLEVLDNLVDRDNYDNYVVLMAGGLGSRLGSLTDSCPKPLLKIGNKPILENILEKFIDEGFHHFYISVNYKSEMIEKYFGNGENWGIEISYIRENKRLGTAGALSLLPGSFTKPLIVMNGDLLTKVNFKNLLDFHKEHKVKATMCVRDYHFQVPYGVVKTYKHKLIQIQEKPVHQFFVSAGIYVLEPDILRIVPRNKYFEMPNLFQKLIEQKKKVTAFPLREYWLDIGKMDDFVKAEDEFTRVFA